MRTVGLKWRRTKGGVIKAIWCCGTEAAKANYEPRTYQVWSGDKNPTEDEMSLISSRVLRLNAERDYWLPTKPKQNKEKKEKRRASPKIKPNPNGSVYFVRSGDFIKIGFSTDVDKRIAKLQAASPHILVLLYVIDGTVDDERAIHERFEKLRVRKLGEWFRYSTEILIYAQSVYLEQNRQRTSSGNAAGTRNADEKIIKQEQRIEAQP